MKKADKEKEEMKTKGRRREPRKEDKANKREKGGGAKERR